ncbi:MAG TPA: tyrosine-type recombinase/integrase [Acetivibrio sp.]|nr:tyrosine-type recombinase/integrase [Acetivibrio sp.]
MTGSLQIKNNKYFIVLNTYDQNGKRKPKWISTGLPVKGNKKKAEQQLREYLRLYEKQERIIKSDMLYSDYIRQWLKQIALKVDVITLQGYEAIAESHILPYFDSLQVKLIDVDRAILQEYIKKKHDNGRIDGKGGLSPASLKLHKNILYQTLKEAVKSNLILTNPCEYVTLPQQQRYDYSFYNAEQLKRLFEAIKDEPLYPLIRTTIIYGLRRSEVLGIKWDSIDFEANTLTIKHTVSKVTKTVEKDKTKNLSSYRVFPLVAEIKQLFLKAKAEEQKNRKLYGREYIENDYVFKWDNGQPYSPDYISRKFRKMLKQYGLPHIRFHELRHSCASLLITQGFTLKDIQEWMGHSDIKMTANIYSHLDVSRKMNIADSIAGSFSE